MAVLLGGVVTGCLYALLALGLVLIFRSSHALTFALGDVGVTGALVAAATAAGSSRLPLGLAVVIGVALGCATNVAIYLVAIRWLERRRTDVSTMIASTLGISILVEGILQTRYGFNPYTTSLFHGVGGVTIGGVNVGGPGLAIVASAIVAFSLLGFILRFTRVGLRLRMGASNPDLAELTGMRALPIRLVVWAIAGGLAAWAMILFSAYSSIDTSGASVFLLTAAVAASCGAFKNIPLTIAGAIVLAVLVDLSAQYISVDVTGLVALALVIPVYIVRQHQEGGLLSRHTGIVTGRTHMRALLRRRPKISPSELAIVAIVGFVALFMANDYWQTLLEQLAAGVVIISGLSISVRYQGRLNLASAAYVLVGEYAAGIGSAHGIPVILAALIGMAAAAAASGLLAALTVNMEEMYYATLTLLLTIVVPEIILWAAGLTGGAQGLGIAPGYFGAIVVDKVPLIALITMAIAVVVVGGVVMTGQSRVGARMLVGVADAHLAGGSGIARVRSIVGGEMAGAALMVLGGVLYSQTSNYVSPTDFGLSASVYLLAALIIGGGWSVIGLVIAAAVYIIFPAELASLGNWISIIYGGGLVLAIMFAPDGLEALPGRLYERVGKRPRRSLATSMKSTTPSVP